MRCGSGLLIGSMLASALANPGNKHHKPSKNHFTTHAWHQKILDQYIRIWAGETSLVDQTFDPDLAVYIDRFPTGTNGSALIGPYVTTPAAFAGFVEKTRTGLREYGVHAQKWAGEGYDIAVRWTIKIVLDDGFGNIPTTLKAGDSASYNGAEYLTLDPCTGLIKEVASAQDLIDFMYNLGNDISLIPIADEA